MKPVTVEIEVPRRREEIFPVTRAVIRRANERSLHRLAEALAANGAGV